MSKEDSSINQTIKAENSSTANNNIQARDINAPIIEGGVHNHYYGSSPQHLLFVITCLIIITYLIIIFGRSDVAILGALVLVIIFAFYPKIYANFRKSNEGTEDSNNTGIRLTCIVPWWSIYNPSCKMECVISWPTGKSFTLILAFGESKLIKLTPNIDYRVSINLINTPSILKEVTWADWSKQIHCCVSEGQVKEYEYCPPDTPWSHSRVIE